MAPRTFTVDIERDPETGWLVGEVKELPGCYTQAPDIGALQENILEAISVYLKSAEPSMAPMDVKGTLHVERGSYEIQAAV